MTFVQLYPTRGQKLWERSNIIELSLILNNVSSQVWNTRMDHLWFATLFIDANLSFTNLQFSSIGGGAEIGRTPPPRVSPSLSLHWIPNHTLHRKQIIWSVAYIQCSGLGVGPLLGCAVLLSDMTSFNLVSLGPQVAIVSCLML